MEKDTNKLYKKPAAWAAVAVVLLLTVVVVWWLSAEPVNDIDNNDVNNEVENIEQGQVPVSSDYVGLSESDAAARAEANGFDHRVVHRDGEDLAVTMDFRPTRLNFWVTDGLVTDAQTDEEMVN